MIETLTKDEPITKPPTRWKNRWLLTSTTVYRNHRTGKLTPRRAGGLYTSNTSFPSKDFAETIAAEIVARQIAAGWQPDIYLGAFPVEGS